MKKITELIENRKRTTYFRDAYGNRERGVEEFTALRPVKTVSQGPRFGHYVVDWIGYSIVLIIFSVPIGFIQVLVTDVRSAVLMNAFVALFNLAAYPAYYIISEHLWQKSPGKFLSNTLVIDEWGNKPSLKQIIFRNLLRLVPFEPFSCFDDKHSYGWHDKWSKTWVVSHDELAELKRLQAEQSEPE